MLFLVITMLLSAKVVLSENSGIMFTPSFTTALRIKNWMDTGVNRAIMAITLGANASSSDALNQIDVLFAFLQNPVYVGRAKVNASYDVYIAATITDTEEVMITYIPDYNMASVLTIPYYSSIEMGAIDLETRVGNVCSTYYRISEQDRSSARQYIEVQLGFDFSALPGAPSR